MTAIASFWIASCTEGRNRNSTIVIAGAGVPQYGHQATPVDYILPLDQGKSSILGLLTGSNFSGIRDFPDLSLWAPDRPSEGVSGKASYRALSGNGITTVGGGDTL